MRASKSKYEANADFTAGLRTESRFAQRGSAADEAKDEVRWSRRFR
ncbi:hypothetical protein ACMYR2_2956 [Nitrobacter sp. TKz-YC01]